jgi:hypothetical protein
MTTMPRLRQGNKNTLNRKIYMFQLNKFHMPWMGVWHSPTASITEGRRFKALSDIANVYH